MPAIHDSPCHPFSVTPCHTLPAFPFPPMPLRSSPHHSPPLLSCRASIIPTVPLPSIPLALIYPCGPNLDSPLRFYRKLSSPCLPLQSLPDPDARRQPASAIPCLLIRATSTLTGHSSSNPANPHLSHPRLLIRAFFPCSSVAIAVKPHHSMPAMPFILLVNFK